MLKIIPLLLLALLSACAAAPLDTTLAPLHDARQLIAKARAAGAEQCAPRELATAVANLALAAHELGEDQDEIHWQHNREPLQQSISAARAALKQCGKPPTIYFAYRSAALSDRARAKLRRFLATTPTGRLSIEGHTDERGTKAFNRKLSRQRAEAVARFLLHHGLADKQIARVIGFGEDRPVAHGHTEAAWHRNRRTEIHVRK